MVGRAILFASVGAAALTLAACEFKSASAGNATAPPNTVSAVPTDVGAPLYQPLTPTPRPTPAANSFLADPVVVRNCQVTLPQTQNVPSKNDGKLLAFCTEPGTDPIPPSEEYIHQRTGKKYRMLHEGDIVKKDQLIAVLDDAVPSAKLDVAIAGNKAAAAALEAAIQLDEVAKAEYDMQLSLKNQNAGTASDLRRAKAQKDQAFAGIAKAKGDQEKAIQEEKLAHVELGEFEIHASIPGMIKRFYRKPGESVKALEPVAEIHNTDALRIEGLLDYQHLSAISSRREMDVVVEASPQFGQVQALEGHLQQVRSVAVNKDKSNPLIVSSSDDKTVRVWDRKTGQRAIFVNSVPVRAVACTPTTASENLCLTGADDGVPRLYNLDSLAPAWKDGETPRAEFKGRHGGQIVSVAFAPNGKYCATADNRDIIIWDVATGDQKYKFPQFHKAPITYIQFTPQCKLVSEARDHSMALWNLGQSAAAVEKIIENRHNDVDVLGVNADGTRVLFDQDRELRVLTTDQKTEGGVMPAPSEASQFVGFALFSPDDRLVLAAGTGDNPLQLWKAPQPGVRGSLIRRLALPPGGNATCGAFAPDGTFAITGTQDARVLVWDMPDKAETDRELRAKVILRDSAIDTDRKARLWAILAKPDGIDLPAGDTVNIVIPPAERRK